MPRGKAFGRGPSYWYGDCRLCRHVPFGWKRFIQRRNHMGIKIIRYHYDFSAFGYRLSKTHFTRCAHSFLVLIKQLEERIARMQVRLSEVEKKKRILLNWNMDKLVIFSVCP
jgi:hypothetical protein